MPKTPFKTAKRHDESTAWVSALAQAIIVQAAQDFREPCGVSDPEIRSFFLSGWFVLLSGSGNGKALGKRILKMLDKEASSASLEETAT